MLISNKLQLKWRPSGYTFFDIKKQKPNIIIFNEILITLIKFVIVAHLISEV